MAKRAFLIVLDSVGIGHAPDASAYGDKGANTLGHLRSAVSSLSLLTLDAAGLIAAEAVAANEAIPDEVFTMSFGSLIEKSSGKDTTTGHWEIAGAPLTEPFATFERFPDALVSKLEEAAGVSFIGNKAASGTAIIDELGSEHHETGHPILYTSADSVIQIAAHEAVIPIEALYEICRACRRIADRERIGRVIARPFIGERGGFTRTPRRHDFSMLPPRTVLNDLEEAGIDVIGVGKIADIFAGSGITESFPTIGNADGCSQIDRLCQQPADKPQLIFANLVDFDMLYGHRRDPEGYARALMDFDRWLSTALPRVDEETLLLITADHGNDPTWAGTDHTREQTPLLVAGPNFPACLGQRESFADIAASLASWFGIKSYAGAGTSFLPA